MSDSDDELSTLRYGTPLEPYDEDEVPAKKKPNQLQDQYAVDAHGRRRFHGAFTGGFSAGFGNSVATPEGFTPATFKSSRAEKASRGSQRPEDFMDDEDRSEFGIAPRHLHTRDEFTGVKRPRQKQYHDGPIPGEPVLEQAIRAVHETAAVKILKSMGWKPGQGVGERLSKKEKKSVAEAHKVYSCFIPEEFRQQPTKKSDEENSSSDSECDMDTLFAPDDYEPYMFRNKTDRFGLGYSGLSRHSVLGNLSGETTSHLVMSDKGKKVSIRGQAFGVGALEEDDDDIYAKEDMSNYDFSLGGTTVEKQKQNNNKQGGGVLEGFVKSLKPPMSVPNYPPPALPRDYRPAVRTSRFESSDKPARNQGLGRHELSPTARGALLGEKPLTKLTEDNQQPTTSTNKENNQSTSKEDVIAKITGRNVNFVTSTSLEIDKDKEKEKSILDFIPISKTNSDTNFVKDLEFNPLSKDASFKPFANDKNKQERYEKFLLDKQTFLIERDKTSDKLSEWERNRELIEFEQATLLYKPLTGVMSDRFTHATQPDDQPTNPLQAVAKSTNNPGLATQEQIDAANKGLYGALTRTKSEWRPEAIVCKRFNVPEPYGHRPEQRKEDKPKVSYSIFEYLDAPVHDKQSFIREQTIFSGSKSSAECLTNQEIKQVTENKSIPQTSEPKKRMTVAELFLKESEEATNKNTEVTETIEKFDKMELYKSIFLSDSEEEQEKVPEKKFTDFTEFIDVPKNEERNTSPPRGIFANINFDEINSWKRGPQNTEKEKSTDKIDKKVSTQKTTNEKTSKKDTNSVVNNQVINEAELYGPKIPNQLIKSIETTDLSTFKPSFVSKSERNKNVIEIESSSSSESWVEAKDLKKQKKKKTKKHKHKKKGKHKKKDR